MEYLNRDICMKEKFIKFIGKMVLPICFATICLSIFRDYIDDIPYLYLLPIRIILLLGAISMIIYGIIIPPVKESKKIRKGKNMKDFCYLNSNLIIEKIFVWYISLYIILRLDKISIIFSFIMLLVFGVFYGYRIANIVNLYLKNRP